MDAHLAYRIGVATALVVRASGAHYAFAPCVGVCRDSRWGRYFISFGSVGKRKVIDSSPVIRSLVLGHIGDAY
ncbi:hypothetical protein RND81_02G170100 [Saponaria officinalis]|uniref:Secreted protein n=1 Tax=Saponaria officinalis TaxID=3572 RepID=A0AAW1MXS4_SAPOF